MALIINMTAEKGATMGKFSKTLPNIVFIHCCTPEGLIRDCLGTSCDNFCGTILLDRLFLLLETGSTPVIRKSAAEQLGEVQKLHPHEFHNLLTKVHTYLGSNNWDTRIAASYAIEAIAKNVPQWDPIGCVKDEAASKSSGSTGRLSFSQFSIQRVLHHGSSLLGSEGAEYDVTEEVLCLDSKERLTQQKQLLNKRLGLDMAAGLGITSEELFREEDLIIQRDANYSPQNASVADLVKRELGGSENSLSARERNRAKRKAKLLAKQVSHDPDKKSTNGDGSDSEPPSKMRKTSSVMLDAADGKDNKIVLDNVPDNTMNMDEMDEWPFESFCEVLIYDLFHTSWERRHGAATGLREVLKLHGRGAGRTVLTPSKMMSTENECWLEDLCIRIICVLALDRFGDFISDEVVAPVRETCAQTLGLALQFMSPEGAKKALMVLLQLLEQNRWEVRHGGLLGIKYGLAVRQDLSEDFLQDVLPAVFKGLQDGDDDVRAVAAAALLPVTEKIILTLPQYVTNIVQCLWLTLLDLDDLTASTNSIMSLLSTILSHSKLPPQVMGEQSLSELVPRLWPFLRHNITSVRRSTLSTLYTLLSKQENNEWVKFIVQDALRHIYQRALLEHESNILDLIYKVWCALLTVVPPDLLLASTFPWLGPWLCLSMQPAHLPFDPNLLIEAKHKQKEQTAHKRQNLGVLTAKDVKDYIGGNWSVHTGPLQRDHVVNRARKMAARLLGLLISILSKSPTPVAGEVPWVSISNLLLFYLSSKSALQRSSVAHVVMEWAKVQERCVCPESLHTRFTECLGESLYFDEIAMSFTRMQTECRNFLASLKVKGINLDEQITPGSVLTIEQATALTGELFESNKPKLKPKDVQTFDDRRHQVDILVQQTRHDQQVLSMRVQSSIAGALVLIKCLPDKLNPIIRPIMESLKREENEDLQEVSAVCMSQLLLQIRTRNPCPNSKVVKNLCTALCSDPLFTPVVPSTIPNSPKGQKKSKSSASKSVSGSVSGDSCPDITLCNVASGILTLNALQKAAGQERTGPGRRPSHIKRALSFTMSRGFSPSITIEAIANEEDESRKQLLIQRRGATIALTTIAKETGANLPTLMPSLWEIIMEKIKYTKSKGNHPTMEEAQDLVHHIQVLEVVGSSVHTDLNKNLMCVLNPLCACLEHPYTAVRHMAARAIGMLCRVSTVETMNTVLEQLLPSLGASENDVKRQGAMEAIANLLDQLGVDIVPYLVLLVVPVMGRMSDQDQAVRLMATQCFANLIRLIPLEAGIPDPPSMSAALSERKEEERRFLEQLLNGSKLENYPIPVPVKAELRKYQQDGVNWLWFMNKYKLHGILCDDMGLGKTLQSICILAGDHANRVKKFKETKQADSSPLPSLVVCPPTLTGHWVYEVEKFVTLDELNPLHYTGPPAERQRLQKRVKKHNLVVASYDVVRNDIDFFESIKWNYCVLDEGHIIKNSKTKLSRAVKQVRANHRLILTGTPIQNNVLELWSLFDFLMPGFLGTEKQFQARFGRPILQSRDAKSSTKEQEAGALAMEALHRQVLPFLLRRMKEDVLQDLPPKIIQDYYCDLSPLQVQLYEDFAKSRAKKSVDDVLVTGTKKQEELTNRSHIFQALQYLRKVCNHPALVLTPNHPQYEPISSKLKNDGDSLHDIGHAPKLTALRQLLNDCGIGLTGSEALDAPVVNQHRVLLFCQLKAMLDIVEKDLFKKQMSNVTYLRLDGSVPAGSRHTIVNRFNNDPSIDVLLLTTHVGGLGLNLTGADTVIFVEHDWNPMKDLQAMDRAHRIGQKKVVNVYRLITRGTLEEKIMGLQKFKMNIANTVINQDNSSMASMGTDQLLDLFTLDSGQAASTSSSSSSTKDGTEKDNMKAILENLGELWDEKQYESEYDMDSFLKSLSK